MFNRVNILQSSVLEESAEKVKHKNLKPENDLVKVIKVIKGCSNRTKFKSSFRLK